MVNEVSLYYDARSKNIKLRTEFGLNDISKFNIYLTEAHMSLLLRPVNECCLAIRDNHFRI